MATAGPAVTKAPTSGGFGLTQHRPINIWPQFFAPNGAARGTLNRWAPFSRNLSHHPVANVLRLHAKHGRQLGGASGLTDGSFNGLHEAITHHVDSLCQHSVEAPLSPPVYAVEVTNDPISRVLNLARDSGWSQVELARRVGVSTQNITNWKKRGIPADKLPDVAEALGCSVDYLLGRNMVEDSVISRIAHTNTLYAYTVPPTKTSEEIVSGLDLGSEFRYALSDDALAPELPKGTDLVWSTTKKPSVGSVVLVVDEHDQLHARRYAQGRSPAEWTARAPNPNYASLEADGLRIAAVAAYEMRAMP